MYLDSNIIALRWRYLECTDPWLACTAAYGPRVALIFYAVVIGRDSNVGPSADSLRMLTLTLSISLNSTLAIINHRSQRHCLELDAGKLRN